MRIDLHTHTNHSDGTDTPAELMRNAAKAGLDLVALTDHDSTQGWAEAAGAVADTGVALVPGVELSCTSRGITVHVLSLLHDPADEVLAEEMARARTSRVDRAREMVRLIAQDYPLAWDDVLAQVGPGATVGRPHIADALVARGHVPDRATAFEHIVAGQGKYYVHHYAQDCVDAVRRIRDAGGVPIFAHPRAESRGRIVSDSVIRAMADAGLVGLEVDHRDHTPAARSQLRELAQELGLLVTGSSDYHGGGKPNELGENVTEAAVFERIEELGAASVVRPGGGES